ncbi:MAG: class I SAM-dependent methyltransferase [Planctomycetota bacterium]
MSCSAPSPWIVRFAGLIARGQPVLDLASGAGRHARFLAAAGHPVLAVDRDPEALADLDGVPGITTRVADLESGDWPLAGETFAGVVVTRYLHRPRFDALVDLLAVGGVLLYETFAEGQEAFGRPHRRDFLLRSGELLERVRGRLEVVAFEQGSADADSGPVLQRVAAIRGNALACILPESGSEQIGGCPAHPGPLRKAGFPTGVSRPEP